MKNKPASADHLLSTDFPWSHRDGRTRARIISETADTVAIAFIRELRAGTLDGEVTLSKPEFLNSYGMNHFAAPEITRLSTKDKES